MPYTLPQADLEKVLRQVKGGGDAPLEYAIGPLEKSQETRLFEKIVMDIITDIENQSLDSYHKKVNFEKKDGKEKNKQDYVYNARWR